MTQQGQYYQQPPPPSQYPPAGNRFHLHGDIIQRFIALLIDCIILFIIYAVLIGILIFVGVFSGGLFGLFGLSVTAIVGGIISFLIVLLYFMVQEGGPSNTTIGKNAMNLKVVDENYQPINMSQAAIRGLMKALWFLPFFGLGIVFFVIDVILVLVREDRQRLGDIVAHTYVVREDAAYGPQPYYAPPPPQYAPPPPPPPQNQQPPPQQPPQP